MKEKNVWTNEKYTNEISTLATGSNKIKLGERKTQNQ
jgi:hypothetical protein